MCKVELTQNQKAKLKKGLCINAYCKNRKGKRRNICEACSSRKYRKNHPLKSAYQNLKNNAKRRGKEFSLTLEQFAQFAVNTFYMDKRGKHHNGLHIDRIDETRGYHADNIQPLTNTENVKKYHAARPSRKNLEEAPF